MQSQPRWVDKALGYKSGYSLRGRDNRFEIVNHNLDMVISSHATWEAAYADMMSLVLKDSTCHRLAREN